jgi:hypothetical protein
MFFHAGRGLVSNSADVIGMGVRGYAIPASSCPWLPERICPTWATALPWSASTVPVLNDDGTVLYVGTNNGSYTEGAVYAIDASDGEVLWSTPTTGVTDTPAMADGRLFVPTVQGLVVVDTATGAISWKTGWAVVAQPAVAGGVVFTGGFDRVMAFPAAGCGAATCAPIWSDLTNSRITGAPAVSNGQLYVGTADRRLLAYGLPEPPIAGRVDVFGDQMLVQAFLYPGSPWPAPSTPGTPEDLHLQYVLNQTFVDGVDDIRRAAHDRRPDVIILELGMFDSDLWDGGWIASDQAALEQSLATPHPDTCIALILPAYTTGFPADHAAQVDKARAAMTTAANNRPNTVVIDSQPVITQYGIQWLPAHDDVEGAHAIQLMLWSGVSACQAL